jgi:hypothetical protein
MAACAADRLPARDTIDVHVSGAAGAVERCPRGGARRGGSPGEVLAPGPRIERRQPETAEIPPSAQG